MRKILVLAAISWLLGTQAHGRSWLQSGGGYCVDLNIVAIGWINDTPNPVTQLIAGGLLDKPNWIVRTYMGLIGTANKAPPNSLSTSSLSALFASRDYRAINCAQIDVNVDPGTLAPLGATTVTSLQDPGWTPPIDQQKFLGFQVLGFFDNKDVNDRNFYRAEMSPISSVVYSMHPNNAISFDDGETVLVSGLMKFRAGQHTDQIGVSGEVGSPFHVPWVWNEFALSYDQGQYKLHVSTAKFPTIYWYVNGQLKDASPQAFDASFPKRAGFSSPIDVNKMQIYPVLSAGAPSRGPQAPIDAVDDGPVVDHPYTVKLRWDDTIIIPKEALGAPHPCLSPPPQTDCIQRELEHQRDPGVARCGAGERYPLVSPACPAPID